MQAPRVGYGAAPIYSTYTYARGFDQKMLQLQGSATQAGQGRKMNYLLSKKLIKMKCVRPNDANNKTNETHIGGDAQMFPRP